MIQMVTNQSTLTTAGETRTIEEIRKGGIDKQMKERIAQEKLYIMRLHDTCQNYLTHVTQPKVISALQA